MSKPQDGFVSRFLNRPISSRITGLLVKFPSSSQRVHGVHFCFASSRGRISSARRLSQRPFGRGDISSVQYSRWMRRRDCARQEFGIKIWRTFGQCLRFPWQPYLRAGPWDRASSFQRRSRLRAADYGQRIGFTMGHRRKTGGFGTTFTSRFTQDIME